MYDEHTGLVVLGGEMGRTFDFQYGGRKLSIRPVPIDEGWELWVMDGDTRLECGGIISVDDAIAGGRCGQDPIRIAADQVKARMLAKLTVESC